MGIRVAFIAAECEPYAKTGGLGDVVDALARALGRLPAEAGIDRPVDVYLPRYRWLPGEGPATTITVPDPPAGGRATVRIVDQWADGYRLRLVDHQAAFDRDGIYGDPGSADYDDNGWRFMLFGRAAFEAIRTDDPPVDVIHGHDWHACPALIARDRWYVDDPVLGRAATVLTVHNLRYHGSIPPHATAAMGLPVGDGLDLLADGIERADLVNTVSPGFADEARTPEFGGGLDGSLRARGDRFFGILNGLDTEVWDPATDQTLAAPYRAADLAGKIACRADLLGRVGFDPGDPGPVLGMVGRLDPQKGFDLVTEAMPALLGLGARLVVLGAGDATLVDRLRQLARARPDRVALTDAFDRDLARRIYAGSDLFLMPSRFEPCGQAQMIAQRYGTPPIVHATGGLRDTVVDEHRNPGLGTGWAFRQATADGLAWAATQAIDCYRLGGQGWQGVVERAMALDFDWRRGAATHYVEAYRRALELRRAPGRSR
ncbi:MAG TPA: glycogen/starch synthase [Candidatus Limnocylindrales bacterium]